MILFYSCRSESKSGEYDDAICKAFIDVGYQVYNIEFIDTIDNNHTKTKIEKFIKSIDDVLDSINDPDLIVSYCPEAFQIKAKLKQILDPSDFSYLRYKVHASYKGERTKIVKYALVSCCKDTVTPIKIVNEHFDSDMYVKLQEIKPSVKSLLEALSIFRTKSKKELQQAKEEKLQIQRKVHKEELALQKKHEEEILNTPSSWDDVTKWVQKKGCTVMGIYKGNLAYSATLILYKKDGYTYLCTCSIDKNPVDFDYAYKLKKINSNTYQYNEPGSDMPERFKICDDVLISFCFNPDINQWVNMGTYEKIR